MSRELKRIAKDFAWPLGKVWYGYLSPYTWFECPACDGSGLNPETKKLCDSWYTHNRTDGKKGWQHSLEQDEVQALVDSNRLRTFTRDANYEPNGYVPTAEEVNKRSHTDFMLHDGINQSICVKVRAKRMGIWGHCGVCDGDGELWHNAEFKKLSDEWEQVDPPEGDGYQLWETCTEGSPVSPVFDTLDDLCVWAADNATTFGAFKTTAEKWKEMLIEDNVRHVEGNVIFM